MTDSSKKINYNLFFWILILSASLIRVIIGSRIGLTGDEAHYWAYFRFPELSYFDHPPAVGYIIGFFSSIFGNNEFAVRLPAVIFFALLCWITYIIAKKLFDEKTAFVTILLLNVIPVFSFLGSVITIPDAPLSVLWMLFILIFLNLIETKKSYYWYILGVILGFGLLCKYNAIMLIPSFFLFLVISKKDRFWLRKPETYISLLIGFIIFLPVIFWNIQNNWASFGFQLKHGLGKAAPKISFELLGRSLGAQAGYISPVLFFLFWFVLFWLGYKYLKNRNEKLLLIFSFAFPTLILFNLIATFNEILPHWPVMGYLVLALGVSVFTLEKWNKLWFRIFSFIGWGLALFLTVLVPLQAMFKVLPPEMFLPKEEAFRIEDGVTRAEKVDITNELYGWRETGKKIAEIIRNYPEPKPFIFTHRHYIASQLAFYIPGHPRVYSLSDRADAYDYWQRDLTELNGRAGIFVTNDYFYTDPAKTFPFDSWNKTEEVDIYRDGRKIRVFYLTVGKKFNLNKLPEEYSSAAVGPKNTILGGLLKLDHSIFWIINKKIRFKLLDYVMIAFTKAEDILRVNLSMVIVVFIAGCIFWIRDKNTFWKEFLLLAGILFIGGIINHLLKDIIARPRPLYLFGDEVNVFYEKLERCSFPSGHSQIDFSVATYLAIRIKKFWWLFIAVAVIMVYMRVYVGSHFPSDVVAGAIIGILVALMGIWLGKPGTLPIFFNQKKR